MRRMRVCALALAALVSAVLPASAADDTAASLREEYTAARRSRELNAEVGQDMVERALKVAKHADDNDERYDAWLLVMEVSSATRLEGDDVHDAKKHALEGIVGVAHNDPEKMVKVVRSYMGGEEFAWLREQLFEKTGSGSVKGACLYAEGMALVYKMRGDDFTEEDRHHAIAALKRAGTEFGKEDDHGRYGNWADAVEGPVFQLENLYIGAIAPDIEGEDLNGVNFKLSDYRGKVVVLDFWGDW